MVDLIEGELSKFASPPDVNIFFSAHGVPKSYVEEAGALAAGAAAGAEAGGGAPLGFARAVARSALPAPNPPSHTNPPPQNPPNPTKP